MNYEKKYKEALNWMKDVYPTLEGAAKEDAEHYFPELKESRDERIKEDIIWCLKHSGIKPDKPINPHVRTTMKDALAWIDKQGEQKTTDKVEPKFKVKYAGSEYNVLEVKDIAGITFYGIEDEPNHIDYVRPDHCEIIRGYGWFPNPTNHADKCDGCNNAKGCVACVDGSEWAHIEEQNPAWSEEDDAMRNFIALILRNHQSDEDFTTFKTTFKDCIDWFKSLKDRVQPQLKQEWNEDTQQWIDAIIKDYEEWYKVNKDHSATIQIKINILKSLKERYTWKPSDEQMSTFWDAICTLSHDGYKWIDDMKSLYLDLNKLNR